MLLNNTVPIILVFVWSGYKKYFCQSNFRANDSAIANDRCKNAVKRKFSRRKKIIADSIRKRLDDYGYWRPCYFN